MSDTIVDSIIKSLKEIGRPSTYEEIYDHIIEHAYYEFGAKNPLSVLRIQLRLHTKNINIKSGEGKAKYFHSDGGIGKNEKFELLDTPVESTTYKNERSIHQETSNEPIVKQEKKCILFLKKTWSTLIENTSTHKKSLTEFIWMLLFSFLPIIFDSFLRKVLLETNFIEGFKQNLHSGEVFLLTSALLSPFFFFICMYARGNNEDKDELPYFGCMLVFTIISLLGGVFTFVYYRIGSIIKDKAQNDMINHMFSYDLTNLAWLIFTISLIVWYYSSFMNHRNNEQFKTIRSKQQKQLDDNYKATETN